MNMENFMNVAFINTMVVPFSKEEDDNSFLLPIQKKVAIIALTSLLAFSVMYFVVRCFNAKRIDKIEKND